MPFKPHPDNPDLVIYTPNEYWIPKPWQSLTDEQLSETYNELYTHTKDDVNIADFILIARAIEVKLKENNT